ncbi:MAG: flagellar protein [Lachnospiraceae bacterium]|jgi:flagellar operon protein|nr:flagellar protein [Lachnospiraceae bacterium]
MTNVNRGFGSIEQVQGQFLKQKPVSKPDAKLNGKSFDQILAEKSEQSYGELKFSKHASERLVSRNIDLSKGQMERLQGGTERARAKGINESLVVVDNLAFIVNVKNNTVVTAVGESDDKIFTNIDGAVIA